jgi:hypothetical protein
MKLLKMQEFLQEFIVTLISLLLNTDRQPETNNEERGQDKSPTQTDQSKEEGEETEQPTNHDEGVMEEQEGFEEVTYGRNRRSRS